MLKRLRGSGTENSSYYHTETINLVISGSTPEPATNTFSFREVYTLKKARYKLMLDILVE